MAAASVSVNVIQPASSARSAAAGVQAANGPSDGSTPFEAVLAAQLGLGAGEQSVPLDQALVVADAGTKPAGAKPEPDAKASDSGAPTDPRAVPDAGQLLSQAALAAAGMPSVPGPALATPPEVAGKPPTPETDGAPVRPGPSKAANARDRLLELRADAAQAAPAPQAAGVEADGAAAKFAALVHATDATVIRPAIPERPHKAELAADTSLTADQTPAVATPALPLERPATAHAQGSAQSSDVAARMGPGFADDVGNRVVWMATNKEQVAELRIDPPHLGPVELRLSIEGDTASLTLTSMHAPVREALQSSLPRLHDMLQAAGVQLGSVHVGNQAPGQQQRGQPARDESTSRLAPVAALRGAEPAVRHGLGLVDTYA